MGMRQRLALAAALLGDPETLVLDEPSNGLDPEGMRWLRGFLKRLAGEGRTVLVSSHLLAELAQSIDDVVIINRGRLVTAGAHGRAARHVPAHRPRGPVPRPDRLSRKDLPMSTIDSVAVPRTFAAERRRLRATRSTTVAVLVAVAFAVALAVANVLLAGHQDNPPLNADALDHVIRAPAQVLGFVMLLVGVLSAAGEYRHGTVVASLLAAAAAGPLGDRQGGRRGPAGAGGRGLVHRAGPRGRGAVADDAGRTGPAPGHAPARGPVRCRGRCVGYGLIGVALGLLLRSQTAALTTALLWQFVVEGVLPVVFRAPDMVRYLPGGAADSVLRLGDRAVEGLLTPWAGVALFSAYALVLVLLALVVRVPRDLS